MKQGLLTQILKYSVGALFLVTALVLSKSTLDSVLLPRWTSALVFSAIISVLSFGAFGNLNPRINFIGQKIFWIGLLGFGVTQLTSIFYAGNTYEAMFVSFKWITWLYLIFLLHQLLRHKVISTNYLVSILIYTGFAIGLIGLMQYVGLDLYKIGEETRDLKGTMANPNLMGSFMVLIFPLGFFGLLEASKKQKIFRAFFLLVVSASIILSGSRTAYVIYILELLFCGFYYLKNFVSPKVLYWIIPSILIVVIAISLVLYQQLDIYNFGALISKGTIKTRTSLFEQTLKMVAENPIFGVGAGNWKIQIAKYGLDAFPEAMQGGTVSYVRPHNDYLWVLAEAGIVGFVFMALFFVGVLKQIFRVIQHNLTPQKTWYLAFSIGAFLLAAFMDYPSERILHLMVFSGVVAIFLSEAKEEQNETQISKLSLLAFGGILMFFSYFATQRMKGEQFSKQVLGAYQAQNGPALQRLFKTEDLKYYDLDPIANPIAFFKGMSYVVGKNLNKATQEFENAIEVHPYHLLSLNNLGAMYKNQGDLNRALVYYDKALAVSPNYERAQLNKLELLFLTGNVEEATQKWQDQNIDKKDPAYEYFFNLMLKENAKYALKRYPYLKEDKKYIDAINNKIILDRMYKGSIKNNVPFHLWILPFKPDSIPPAVYGK